MDKETCLRCGGHMSYVGRERLKKELSIGLPIPGAESALPGSFETDIYVCDTCHKMEFYAAKSVKSREKPEEGNSIAQIPCPHCGTMHDMDDPRCPFCGKRLTDTDDGKEHEEP